MKYRDHFDELGQLRTDMGWSLSDKVIAVCLAIVILVLMTGAI